MRRISHADQDDSFGEPRAEPWWDSVSLAEKLSFQVVDVLCILGQISAQLDTPEGQPLRWMQEPVDCAFADVDRILQKLQGGTEP